jgi:hypothetical protein
MNNMQAGYAVFMMFGKLVPLNLKKQSLQRCAYCRSKLQRKNQGAICCDDYIHDLLWALGDPDWPENHDNQESLATEWYRTFA